MSVKSASEFRKTVKKYIDKKIKDEDLDELLDIARFAPSSMGLEPTRILVIRNKKIKEKLANEVFEGNNTNLVKTADTLLIFNVLRIQEVMKTSYWIKKWKKLNLDEERIKRKVPFFKNYLKLIEDSEGDFYCQFQSYITASFLMLAAADKKIGTSFLGGFKPNIDSTLEEMGLIDLKAQKVSICMALGYYDVKDPTVFYESNRIDKDIFIKFIN